VGCIEGAGPAGAEQSEENTMGKRLAAVGMAAVIAGGGLTVAAVNPLGVAGASGSGTPTTSTASGATAKAHRKGPLQRALEKLVADHTLTQAQADKVMSTTKDEVKAGRKHAKTNRRELLGVVAKTIGVQPKDIVAGLKDGKSIAVQAQAKGVSRQTVDDAVTKVLTARIDAAVTAGKITPEQATKAKGRLDKVVDRILDADGHRLGRRAGRGN
jgi:Spy/CpxP family protein refolding chaperone